VLEEDLATECASLLSNVFLQVEVVDRWVWKLHSSDRYTVKSAYNKLTAADVDFGEGFNHVFWIKTISLKVNIFIWCLLLNRMPTKDNLFGRHILSTNDIYCSAACGCIEDRDHLFFQCSVYRSLWNFFQCSAPQGKLLDNLIQFEGLGGFSNKSCLAFDIICTSVVYVICKKQNRTIFNHKAESLTTLTEDIKIQTFWWIKLFMFCLILIYIT